MRIQNAPRTGPDSAAKSTTPPQRRVPSTQEIDLNEPLEVTAEIPEDAFGTIRVKRFVSVQDVGRIMNEKTARSQIIGGVIYGLGSALMEASEYDKRWANPVTRHLGDYHVPVQLDVPEIDVYFMNHEFHSLTSLTHSLARSLTFS